MKKRVRIFGCVLAVLGILAGLANMIYGSLDGAIWPIFHFVIGFIGICFGGGLFIAIKYW